VTTWLFTISAPTAVDLARFIFHVPTLGLAAKTETLATSKAMSSEDAMRDELGSSLIGLRVITCRR
jgi:hypothetical protein